jgi:hypothetical protein
MQFAITELPITQMWSLMPIHNCPLSNTSTNDQMSYMLQLQISCYHSSSRQLYQSTNPSSSFTTVLSIAVMLLQPVSSLGNSFCSTFAITNICFSLTHKHCQSTSYLLINRPKTCSVQTFQTIQLKNVMVHFYAATPLVVLWMHAIVCF